MVSLTLEQTRKAIAAAQAKAREIGITISTAVVDEGANLVAFERMENAMIISIQIAIDKAYTTAGSGFPTHELGKIAQPGAVAYGLANTDRGRVMIFGGGIPIKIGGKAVGGIGVSGGLADQDAECATAGAKAVAT